MLAVVTDPVIFLAAIAVGAISFVLVWAGMAQLDTPLDPLTRAKMEDRLRAMIEEVATRLVEKHGDAPDEMLVNAALVGLESEISNYAAQLCRRDRACRDEVGSEFKEFVRATVIARASAHRLLEQQDFSRTR